MSDTSEIAEMFKEHKEERRIKKQSNLEYSTELLRANGIKFESKNNGIHLIVQGKDCKIHFWPSTGKYSAISGEYGRGVRNVIKLCL